MKLRASFTTIIASLLLLLCTLSLLPSIFVEASNDYITDDAKLLNKEETQTLTSLINDISSTYGINVRIFTVNSMNGKSGTAYLDDLEDRLNVSHAVFIVIDMSTEHPSKRSYTINTFDDTNTKYFNQKRRDSIRDAAIKKLKKNDYYGGLHTSLKMIQKYAKTDPKTDSVIYQSWVQLILCAVISGLIVFRMAYTSGGKVTTNARTYLNKNASRVLGQYDHYIRTTTTRVKRETSSSSGSDTHTTSGGHSSGSSSGNF